MYQMSNAHKQAYNLKGGFTLCLKRKRNSWRVIHEIGWGSTVCKIAYTRAYFLQWNPD